MSYKSYTIPEMTFPPAPGTLQDTERARQLADIAASGDEDNVECAAADLAREFPGAGD